MSWVYRRCVRPVLFRCDSEWVHNLAIEGLATLSPAGWARGCLSALYASAPRPVECLGLHFPNPVGLAAGMDKFARALPIWECLGFGFCELGGVTWVPQPGNERPRMFRAVGERALVNRMGFNNPGAEAMAATLRDWKLRGFWPRHPVGINLGKSKITPLEEAAEDYARSLEALLPYGDFFVINVSSPNTPGLRSLQGRDELKAILASANRVLRRSRSNSGGVSKPLLIKVAPELSWEAYDELVELGLDQGLAGIVATNTTTQRPKAKGTDAAAWRVFEQAGGLSGAPLRARSTAVVRHLAKASSGKLAIIGVGGVFTADDLREKLDAGASLVQVYTGFVFQGPGLAKELMG